MNIKKPTLRDTLDRSRAQPVLHQGAVLVRVRPRVVVDEASHAQAPVAVAKRLHVSVARLLGEQRQVLLLVVLLLHADCARAQVGGKLIALEVAACLLAVRGPILRADPAELITTLSTAMQWREQTNEITMT